jgi:hypothetical protein
MTAPSMFAATVNLYRALPLSDLRQPTKKVTVPTMYMRSDRDVALLPKAAHATGRYVTGEYRFETRHGVTHWMPDQEPDAVAVLLLDWFAKHRSWFVSRSEFCSGAARTVLAAAGGCFPVDRCASCAAGGPELPCLPRGSVAVGPVRWCAHPGPLSGEGSCRPLPDRQAETTSTDPDHSNAMRPG